MRQIGFGTGCLYKNVNPASLEAIELVAQSGAKLIEISIVLSERLADLGRIKLSDVSAFGYVALHAPADIRYRDDMPTKKVLGVLADACARLNARHVSFHPDTVEDMSVIDSASLPAAFENMDKFKNFGRTVEDMGQVVSGKRKMVLDLVHAYTNDPDMKLARDLLERFKNSIVTVHLSGCQKHEEDSQHHYPVSLTKQEEIFIPLPEDLPVVIESVWPKAGSLEKLTEGMKGELGYVRGRFG